MKLTRTSQGNAKTLSVSNVSTFQHWKGQPDLPVLLTGGLENRRACWLMLSVGYLEEHSRFPAATLAIALR